jgi:hypothetical protein
VTIAQLFVVVEILSYFESATLFYFFSKKKSLLYFYLNKSQINGYQRWEEILMITLIPRKKLLAVARNGFLLVQRLD